MWISASPGHGTLRELFPYQKLVRGLHADRDTRTEDLLLYHGLGSGKTCSSIAVAEVAADHPEGLRACCPRRWSPTTAGEIRKCGRPDLCLFPALAPPGADRREP
jgi:hypothetical protein